MVNKLLSMLGLAKRAGKLKTGYDASVGALRDRSAVGIVIASDISEKTEKNIRFEAENAFKKVIKVKETIEEISCAIGKKAGIVAFLDAGFFKAVFNIVDGEAKSADNQPQRKENNL